MIIYVDVLLVTNFLISYFLLIGSALLMGYTYNRKRILIASIIGSFFCLYILVQNDNKMLDFLIKLASLLVCVFIAYGMKNKRSFIFQSICYVFLNMMMTGIAVMMSYKSSVVLQKNMFFYFDISPVLLVLSSCVIYLLILIFQSIKERVSPKEQYDIDIYFKNFVIEKIPSFYDTGFKIKDVIANKDIVLVSLDKVKDKIPLKIFEAIKSYFDGEYKISDVIIIPIFYNSVKGGGMLPAIRTEYIIIDGKKIDNIVVAFTENELSESVSAIFGTEIKKQL